MSLSAAVDAFRRRNHIACVRVYCVEDMRAAACCAARCMRRRVRRARVVLRFNRMDITVSQSGMRRRFW